MVKIYKSWLKNVIAVLLIGIITFAIGCENNTSTSTEADSKKVISIGYLPITHALSVFKTKELLEEESSDITIELKKFSSWTDLMDALNTGRIDGASVLVELAMISVSQGNDLKCIGLGHKDGNVIVASDDIKSVQDLKGKKFAIPSKQSSHDILLNEMLIKNGLSIDDVDIIQLSPTEMPSSLASKVIDAYCVAEPFGAQAVKKNIGHVLYTSEELWQNSICCSFVLTGKFIDKDKTTADKLVSTYFEAGKSITQDNILELAKKYLGQNEETLKTSLQWIHFDDLRIKEDEYNELVEKVEKYKINENPPEYKDFIYQQ